MGLQRQIEALASPVHEDRDSAAEEIFVAGAVLARRAARAWMKDADLGALIGPDPAITVGIAVSRDAFARISGSASGSGCGRI